MPYTPTTWVDNTTPLSATNLNHIEGGIDDATDDAAAAAADALDVANDLSAHEAGTTAVHGITNTAALALAVNVPQYHFAKPAANITRAATSIGAFSTAWQITSVVVVGAQNVKLTLHAAIISSAANMLFVLLRNSTQVAALRIESGSAGVNQPVDMTWIDENPGAATYTYEVQAAAFGSGTITVYQTNITTDADGGSSIFTAEVYTP